MMLSTFSAPRMPNTMPQPTPMTPIRVPCTMKMRITSPGEAPMVRRIAISACFSRTIMYRLATMLKAAMAMIKNSSSDIMRFSSSTARKYVALKFDQSLTETSGGSTFSNSRATWRARNRSSSFSRTPLTCSSIRYNRCASPMCTTASPESIS